jgi:hypothetical protein
MTKRLIMTALAGLLAGSCGGEILDGGEPSEADVGLVALAVTNAPADADCLRITAAGATTAVRSFGLKPGQSSVLMLGGLPTGRVVLTGEAFNSACGAVKPQSVASWVSQAATVMLAPGQAAQVTLVLTRPGQATVAVDFGGGGCGSGCPGDAMCVMNRCLFRDGAACMSADMCLGGFCTANRCASRPPEMPRPPGAPCTANDQCQMRRCVMGRCQ